MERLSRALRSLVKHLKDSRGVSLYEITAAVAMTGILAAVAVPVIIDKVTEAKSARAIQEVDGIYKAMQAFQNDTGKLPGQAEGAMLLKSGGGMPGGTAGSKIAAVCGSATAAVDCPLLDRFLVGPLTGIDVTNYPGWKGPYIGPIPGDPFERAYIVNVQALYKVDGIPATAATACGFGWVISGGPNRDVETSFGLNAVDVSSDDLARNNGKKNPPGVACTKNAN